MAKKRTGKIEILDDTFARIVGTVDSGNLRVTFRSGATLDIYIADDDHTMPDTCLYIAGRSKVHHAVLVGRTETDFEITMQKVRS